MSTNDRIKSFSTALTDIQMAFIESEREISKLENENEELRKLCTEMLAKSYVVYHEHTAYGRSSVDSPLDNLIFKELSNAWTYIEEIISSKIDSIDIEKNHPHIHIGSHCIGLYLYDGISINPYESDWFCIIRTHTYEGDV